MGIDPSSVNVSDLEISRPDRSGPGGDIVGTPTVLGSGLDACLIEEDRIQRSGRGKEIIILGRAFIDPIRDDAGDVVPVVPGDLMAWTDLQGTAKNPQEVISVEGITDCTGDLDLLSIRFGRTTTVV